MRPAGYAECRYVRYKSGILSQKVGSGQVIEPRSQPSRRATLVLPVPAIPPVGSSLTSSTAAREQTRRHERRCSVACCGTHTAVPKDEFASTQDLNDDRHAPPVWRQRCMVRTIRTGSGRGAIVSRVDGHARCSDCACHASPTISRPVCLEMRLSTRARYAPTVAM